MARQVDKLEHPGDFPDEEVLVPVDLREVGAKVPEGRRDAKLARGWRCPTCVHAHVYVCMSLMQCNLM